MSGIDKVYTRVINLNLLYTLIWVHAGKETSHVLCKQCYCLDDCQPKCLYLKDLAQSLNTNRVCKEALDFKELPHTELRIVLDDFCTGLTVYRTINYPMIYI